MLPPDYLRTTEHRRRFVDHRNHKVALYVAGRYACFSDPFHRIDRISYPVPTPSAAQGMLKAIYWKPEMEYCVTRIDVLRPIQWTSFSINERRSWKGKTRCETVPRSNIVLRDVAYVVEAYIQCYRGEVGKHLAIFQRRLGRQQCYRYPYLGLSDYLASEFREPTPHDRPVDLSGDVGMMLHSLDWDNAMQPQVYHARLESGSIHVPEVAAC